MKLTVLIVKTTKLLFTLALISFSIGLLAQAPKRYTSSEIYLKLEKLNVLGNALYVAAHPDDENTRMITYLANDLLVNAGYLSMTRGDGGQNLIGPEIREQLGLIRTQELLAARRIDGGQQFFTRANDFGYSKNTEETQKIWDREEVLKDVVWTYRKFRPDVIITRFPVDSRGGHGHHTTSAILALEAFKISGDPSIYPEQLEYLEPWAPKRILMNTGRWWSAEISDEDPGVISMDIGTYNTLLGESYSEIAATSRSQHKSQGFGSTGSRGSSVEYLEHMDGVEANDDLFEGIDITWARVKGGDKISRKIESLLPTFDHNSPALIIPGLIDLKKQIKSIPDSFWKTKKLVEVDDLIKACSGLYLEIVATNYSAVPGDSVGLRIEAINRSNTSMILESITIKGTNLDKTFKVKLDNNVRQRFEEKILLPENLPYSNPYWLNKAGSLGMYSVDDLTQRGKPENDPSLIANVSITIRNEKFDYEIPVVYKWNDRVDGELYRPFVILPAAMLTIVDNVVIFADEKSKMVEVRVQAGTDQLSGQVSLSLPNSWRVEPEYSSLSFSVQGEEQSVFFEITPPQGQQEVEITAEFKSGRMIYDQSLVNIEYDHIPTQTLLPKATAKLVRLNIARRGEVIGYIMGAGDEVPKSLEQIGYKVWVMNEDDVTPENLATLDAVIMGIRAVNTNANLKRYNPYLLDYVYQGGTLIYQFNTSRRINWKDFAPYEISFSGGSSDSRVSVEEAEITILKPDHPVLNSPNQITSADFDGWVQERGLYFPNKWDENYEAILSSHDPGEEAKDGGLLVAKYGSGYYVYTGYAWFRQLPAGVPGAFRLFTNIISLGNDQKLDESKINLKQ